MSVEMMSWVFRQDIPTSSRKLTLLALADFAGQEGSAWASIETLAAKTSLNRKTVIQAIADLEEMGYLHDTGARRGATGQIKVYSFETAGHEESELDKQYRKRNSTENGTVPKTDGNSPVFTMKESQKRTVTVPKTGHEPLRTISEPTTEPLAAPVYVPEWKIKRDAEDALIAARLALNPEWEAAAIAQSQNAGNKKAYQRSVLLAWENGSPGAPTSKKELAPPSSAPPPAEKPVHPAFRGCLGDDVSDATTRLFLGQALQALAQNGQWVKGESLSNPDHIAIAIAETQRQYLAATPSARHKEQAFAQGFMHAAQGGAQ